MFEFRQLRDKLSRQPGKPGHVKSPVPVSAAADGSATDDLDADDPRVMDLEDRQRLREGYSEILEDDVADHVNERLRQLHALIDQVDQSVSEEDVAVPDAAPPAPPPSALDAPAPAPSDPDAPAPAPPPAATAPDSDGGVQAVAPRATTPDVTDDMADAAHPDATDVPVPIDEVLPDAGPERTVDSAMAPSGADVGPTRRSPVVTAASADGLSNEERAILAEMMDATAEAGPMPTAGGGVLEAPPPETASETSVAAPADVAVSDGAPDPTPSADAPVAEADLAPAPDDADAHADPPHDETADPQVGDPEPDVAAAADVAVSDVDPDPTPSADAPVAEADLAPASDDADAHAEPPHDEAADPEPDVAAAADVAVSDGNPDPTPSADAPAPEPDQVPASDEDEGSVDSLLAQARGPQTDDAGPDVDAPAAIDTGSYIESLLVEFERARAGVHEPGADSTPATDDRDDDLQHRREADDADPEPGSALSQDETKSYLDSLMTHVQKLGGDEVSAETDVAPEPAVGGTGPQQMPVDAAVVSDAGPPPLSQPSASVEDSVPGPSRDTPVGGSPPDVDTAPPAAVGDVGSQQTPADAAVVSDAAPATPASHANMDRPVIAPAPAGGAPAPAATIKPVVPPPIPASDPDPGAESGDLDTGAEDADTPADAGSAEPETSVEPATAGPAPFWPTRAADLATRACAWVDYPFGFLSLGVKRAVGVIGLVLIATALLVATAKLLGWQW